MIGNDIIDLTESRKESNWQRKGWIAKLFSPAEQQLITRSDNREILVWLMWSMKESVYKISNRQTAVSCYAPRQLVCQQIIPGEGLIRGKVVYEDIAYYTLSTVLLEYIHTIAAVQNNLAQATVYIRNTVESSFTFPRGQVFFRDAAGIPYLKELATGKIKDISKSHHGRFEAIAFF